MSSSSSTNTSDALRSVLSDMEIRHQVESCVREMVTDVEYAHHLSVQLQHEMDRQAWEKQNRAQQLALQESYMERQQLKQQCLPLADGLVKDLYQTSRELGKYYQLQNKHSALTNEYDELLAKLLQAEDRIRMLQEEKEQAFRNAMEQEQEEQQQQAAAAAAAVSSTTAMPAVASTTAEVTPADAVSSASQETKATTNAAEQVKPEATAAVTKETPPIITETIPATITAAAPEASSETQPTAVVMPPPAATVGDTAAETTTTPAAAALVSLEADDDESTANVRVRIEDFEDVILMNIFGFLDALEILNTAQINTRMYTRVDSLFGLGDGGNDNTTISSTDDGSTTMMGGGGGSSYTAPATATIATMASTDSANQSTSNSTTTNNENLGKPRSNSTGSAPAATTTMTSSTGTSNTAGAAMPVSPPRDAGLAALSSTQQQASAVMNNVFQFLQPRRPAGNTASATPNRRGGGGGSGNAPIMNAATASSVAAKLTDSELNAILGMMERMRKNEAAVERLKAENEQLRAEWEGTESVKNFLVQKVRDMEESMSRQEENDTKVAQQIASDQEVIAFLDARVQELEQQVSSLQATKTDLEAGMSKMRSNLEQKTTVLQDMLHFERERFVEFEKEAKSTKKVLVKEIKLCRNQIVALTAERDAYKEQNETLQKAVMHSSNGTAAERIYA